MSLRRQLLIVSLLLLCLPWAGCQYVREMEGALRQGQADALQATADSVAAVISTNPSLLYPEPDRTYSTESERSFTSGIIIRNFQSIFSGLPNHHRNICFIHN